jgi:type 1 glutamine amidotransferase
VKKFILRTFAVLGVLLLAGTGVAAWQYYQWFGGGGDVFEREPPVLPKSLGAVPLLVFTKTNGFRHDSIPASVEALKAIAAENGWTIFETNSGAVFNADQLAHFKAVIFSNVSGNVLLPEQRAAFEQYLHAGGGYLGIHGAGGDPSYDWRWYLEELLRARFIGHPMNPQLQRATLRIEDRDDPATRHLGDTWVRSDEWYSFEKSPRGRVHVLATLDETTYRPKVWGKDLGMGADHPVIWKHCLASGRVFYSAMGHTAESYAEPPMRKLLAGAIRWTAGLEGEKCIDGSLDAVTAGRSTQE